MKLTIIFSFFLMCCMIYACNQDGEQNDIETTQFQDVDPGGFHIRPPAGFESVEESEQDLFIENMEEKDILSYKENYRIAEYLKSVGILDQVLNKIQPGDILQNIQFNSLLTDDQINELNGFEVNNTISRSCIYTWIGCFYKSNGWINPYWKRYKKVWIKRCNNYYNGLYVYYTSVSCF